MSKNDPRKALGKGLHSLLPARGAPAATAATPPPPKVLEAPEGPKAPGAPDVPKDGNVSLVPIGQVKPNPNQPRRSFDNHALAELALSIERDGIIQPIVVRRLGPEEYQIIAGERRWRAAMAVNLKEIPIIPREASDEQVLELAIIENIQREDLNPIELAQAFQRMGAELGLSHEEIGLKTSKERTTVTNTIRLLQLPEDVQKAVATGELSQGHARALLKLPDEFTQMSIAGRCIIEGWSVRQIEEVTRSIKVAADPSSKKPRPEPVPLDPNVKAAIAQMESRLGTRVRIIEKAGNKGLIEIEYYSSDDLDRIYNAIAGETT